MNRKTKWNKEKLIDKIKNIVNKIGRVPTCENIQKYGLCKSTVRNHFVSWNVFLEEAGLPTNSKPTKLPREIRQCELCNKNFEVKQTSKQRFCSHKCANIIIAKKNIKHGRYVNRYEEKICPECDKKHSRPRSYFCSAFCKLLNDNRKVTKKDATRHKYAQRNKYELIRVNCRTVAKYCSKDKCENCGYDLHTNVCHIKGISEFDDNATLYEINHPDNLIWLCRNCHWELDHDHLKIEDIR